MKTKIFISISLFALIVLFQNCGVMEAYLKGANRPQNASGDELSSGDNTIQGNGKAQVNLVLNQDNPGNMNCFAVLMSRPSSPIDGPTCDHQGGASILFEDVHAFSNNQAVIELEIDPGPSVVFSIIGFEVQDISDCSSYDLLDQSSAQPDLALFQNPQIGAQQTADLPEGESTLVMNVVNFGAPLTDCGVFGVLAL